MEPHYCRIAVYSVSNSKEDVWALNLDANRLSLIPEETNALECLALQSIFSSISHSLALKKLITIVNYSISYCLLFISFAINQPSYHLNSFYCLIDENNYFLFGSKS